MQFKTFKQASWPADEREQIRTMCFFQCLCYPSRPNPLPHRRHELRPLHTSAGACTDSHRKPAARGSAVTTLVLELTAAIWYASCTLKPANSSSVPQSFEHFKLLRRVNDPRFSNKECRTLLQGMENNASLLTASFRHCCLSSSAHQCCRVSQCALDYIPSQMILPLPAPSVTHAHCANHPICLIHGMCAGPSRLCCC
jgi:hypothetical protein